MNNAEIKNKIIELSRGMASDSKKESYRCEKELCAILQEIADKKMNIESMLNVYYYDYFPIKPVEPTEPVLTEETVTIDTIYLEDCIELPEEISCNCGEFIFHTEWIDMDWEKYFEEVKETKLGYIKSKINDIENNLANEKARYEKYNNLTYKEF